MWERRVFRYMTYMKINFSVKVFWNKHKQICSSAVLQICSHLLKKSLWESLVFLCRMRLLTCNFLKLMFLTIFIDKKHYSGTFYENSWQLLAVSCFHKKPPSQMFDWVQNILFKFQGIWLFLNYWCIYYGVIV